MLYTSTLFGHCLAGAIIGATRDRHGKFSNVRYLAPGQAAIFDGLLVPHRQINQPPATRRFLQGNRRLGSGHCRKPQISSCKLALLCHWAPALLHRVICQGRLSCHWLQHSGRRGMSHLQTGLASISLSSNTADAQAASQRLWIDCGELCDCICMQCRTVPTIWSSAMIMAADAGVDDAQAILIALSQSGVHVEAISAVHGNVVTTPSCTMCSVRSSMPLQLCLA